MQVAAVEPRVLLSGAAPEFSQSAYEFTMTAGMLNTSNSWAYLGEFVVTDPDGGEWQQFSVSFATNSSPHISGAFDVMSMGGYGQQGGAASGNGQISFLNGWATLVGTESITGTMTVTDSDGNTDTADLILNVINHAPAFDAGDNIFEFTAAQFAQWEIGTTIGYVHATDPDWDAVWYGNGEPQYQDEHFTVDWDGAVKYLGGILEEGYAVFEATASDITGGHTSDFFGVVVHGTPVEPIENAPPDLTVDTPWITVPSGSGASIVGAVLDETDFLGSYLIELRDHDDNVLATTSGYPGMAYNLEVGALSVGAHELKIRVVETDGEETLNGPWHDVTITVEEPPAPTYDFAVEYSVYEDAEIGTFVGSLGESLGLATLSVSGWPAIPFEIVNDHGDIETTGPLSGGDIYDFEVDVTSPFLQAGARVRVRILVARPVPNQLDNSAVTGVEDREILLNIDQQGAFKVVIVAQPGSGKVAKHPTKGWRYVPNAAFTGIDSFQYRLKNINGDLSPVATVSVTVEKDDGLRAKGEDPRWESLTPKKAKTNPRPSASYYLGAKPAWDAEDDPGASGNLNDVGNPSAGFGSVPENAGNQQAVYDANLNLYGRLHPFSIPAMLATPTAYEHLKFFANSKNSGKMTLDVKRMLSNDKQAKADYDAALAAAVIFINSLQFIGTLNFSERWSRRLDIDHTDVSRDYDYAIGEYSAYGSGSATATLQADGRLKYTMSFTWNIWDPYDWNAAFGGADAENALLHLVGRAKQFLVEGSFTKTVEWIEK